MDRKFSRRLKGHAVAPKASAILVQERNRRVRRQGCSQDPNSQNIYGWNWTVFSFTGHILRWMFTKLLCQDGETFRATHLQRLKETVKCRPWKKSSRKGKAGASYLESCSQEHEVCWVLVQEARTTHYRGSGPSRSADVTVMYRGLCVTQSC